jgi:hypothetical protein
MQLADSVRGCEHHQSAPTLTPSRTAMQPIRPAAPLLAAAAACGTPEQDVPDPSVEAATSADTARAPAPREDARVESVRRRLDEAQRADEARRQEALKGIDPP